MRLNLQTVIGFEIFPTVILQVSCIFMPSTDLCMHKQWIWYCLKLSQQSENPALDTHYFCCCSRLAYLF